MEPRSCGVLFGMHVAEHYSITYTTSRADMQANRGFSLIELMIVVAIIAVLAAIAFPIYQGYVAKTQAASALEEISIGKVAYEQLSSVGASDAEFTNAALGLQLSTVRCSSISVAPPIGSGSNVAISCTISGAPGAQGETISLERGANGGWQCRSSVAAVIRPNGCIAS